MANIFNSPGISRIFLCSALTAFTMTTVSVPLQATQRTVNINDIGFAVRIEKLIEKVKCYQKKSDSSKLIDTMFDIKTEVEGYTGQRINLDNQLDQVEHDIKRSGGKLKNDDMKQVRKLIKKKEKRSNHKAMYIAACLEYNLPYNAEEEHCLYMARRVNDKEEDDIYIPLRVTIGITVALCGLFLTFVPIPICKLWGPDLMRAGVVLAVEGTINRVEEDRVKTKK